MKFCNMNLVSSLRHFSMESDSNCVIDHYKNEKPDTTSFTHHLKATCVKLLGLIFLVICASVTFQSRAVAVLAVTHFEDTTSSVAVSDIPRQTFADLKGGIARGYTEKVHWFRLEFEADIDPAQEIFIRLRPSFLDEVSLYLVQDGQLKQWRELGDKTDISVTDAPVGFLGFVWPRNANVVYARIATQGSLQANFIAQSVDEARLQADQVLSLQSIYVGFVLFLMVLALVYFVYEKNALFVTFFVSQALYLGVFLLLSDGFVGLINQYMPLPRGLFSDFLVPLATLAAIGFHYSLFNALGVSKPPKRVLQILLLLCVVAFALVSLRWVRLGLQLNSVSMLLGPLAYVWAVFCINPTNRRDKIYYIIVYCFLGLSITFWTLPMIGASKPNFFSENSLIVYGVLTSVLIFLVLSRYQHSLRFELEQVRIELSLERERAKQTGQKKIATKQLVDLVAHEIRTAGAVIAMNLPLDELGDKKANRCQMALGSISLLIDRLIASEEVDHWYENLAVQRIEVDRLLTEGVQRVGFPDRIELTCPYGLSCHSNYFYLLIAIENLLDNAIKYGSPDKPIAVSAAFEDNGCLIRVANTVSPVLQLDTKRIFERYYRSKAHGSIRGSGVGLFLVRVIVERVGGWVAAKQTAEQVEFKLWLPTSSLQ